MANKRPNGLRTWSLGVALTVLAGCQSGVGVRLGPQASFAIDAQPLTQPQGFDWSSQSITGPRVAEQREAYIQSQLAGASEAERSVLAWSSASAGWATGGAPGLALTAFGAAATDTMPNGPASTFVGGTVPAELHKKIFFLTRNGLLIKTDKTNPTGSFEKLQLGSGKTFSKTNITLSPSCTRAYCLADDGTLYVVGTKGAMAIIGTASVAGGYGIAPTLDPFRSKYDDHLDKLYVPDNAGNVTAFDVGYGPDVFAQTATYPVASGITPIVNATYNPGRRKIMSPAVVLKGVIFQNDEAGNLQVYDTNNPLNSVTYPLGNVGIDVAPAIEIQDGSYSGLLDPFGNPATTSFLDPIYAFVNVMTRNGPVCAWVNLVSQSVSFSRFLYFDDNDRNRTADYWHNYNYKRTKVTRYLEAKDGGNIAMDSSDLPGYGRTWSNDTLVAAQTNLVAPTAGATIPTRNQPQGITFDTAGYICVTNKGANTVQRLRENGTVVGTYNVGNSPMGITLDEDSGDLWVANQGSNSITRITDTGVVTTFTSPSFNQPTGIAYNTLTGNLWVTNKGNNTVCEVTTAGVVVATKAVGTQPVAVAVDQLSGDVWVANQGSNNVTKIQANGSIKGPYTTGGGSQPVAIAVAPNGNVWVSCFGSDRVVELSASNGAIATSVTVTQSQGVVVDSAGDVWATSKNTDTVVKISGGVIINSLKTGKQPYGVDVGPAGVAVANFNDNSVTLTNAPGGGPVYSFLRFQDTNTASYAAGSSILSAKLSLTTTASTNNSCYPPEIWSVGATDTNGSTGVYKRGTTTIWRSNGDLTAANAPALGENVGIWMGGGINKQGLVKFGKNKQFDWDVMAGVGAAVPVPNFAFAVRYNPATTNGNNVYWEGGPLKANSKGNKPPFYPPQFQNNALNANPTPATSDKDARPVLTLEIGVNTAVPTFPLQAAPVIDARKKKVYVLNTNYLYSLDFSNVTTWTDSAYNSDTGTGPKYTTYNATYWGRNGGATTNNKTNFVLNSTTPVVAYDGSAIYCINYWPFNGNNAPPYTSYQMAVTKINLPLVPGTDRQVPATGAPGTAVANSLFRAALNGNGRPNLPDSSQYMILDPFNNPYKGGGLYFGLAGSQMIYQFDP